MLVVVRDFGFSCSFFLANRSLPAEREHHNQKEIHSTSSYIGGRESCDHQVRKRASEHEEDPKVQEHCDAS